MSLYDVQKVMFLIKQDHGFAQALKDGPGQALAPFALSDRERTALLEADLPALYRMGAHPLLLAPYSRAMGVPRPRYLEALGPLKGLRRLSSAFLPLDPVPPSSGKEP